ncbi:MAG: BtpA/SgcQ family protein [Hyphomicrobiaceae bacterium]
MLQETFGTKKPIIAMVHFPPLPSTPLYDKAGGMQGVIDAAAKDIEALQAGGVDCIMFGNEGDRPYVTKATPATLAAMSFAVGQLKPLIKVPFGVNYLWDPVATVSLAVASGARFAREIFTGVYASDMGLWVPNAMEAQRLKVECGRSDLKLLYNINAEFAAPVGERAITARAKSAVFAGLADVVLVSGPMTGEAVETGELSRVKDVLPKTPVFANTGCNIDNIGDILRIGDGAIVGTHFKVDGNTWNAVDRARVARFMDKVRTLR